MYQLNKVYGSQKWHAPLEILNKDNIKMFNLTESPTGCGIYIMHDYYSYLITESPFITAEEFKEIVLSTDVRTIVTFCGTNHHSLDTIQFLVDLGFKVVDTYRNAYHRGNDHQSCLIYTI